MRTALDSSVILDVLTNDKTWVDASQKSLKQAMSEGSLVIGECVMAEITPAMDSSEIAVFLLDWESNLSPPASRQRSSLERCIALT